MRIDSIIGNGTADELNRKNAGKPRGFGTALLGHDALPTVGSDLPPTGRPSSESSKKEPRSSPDCILNGASLEKSRTPTITPMEVPGFDVLPRSAMKQMLTIALLVLGCSGSEQTLRQLSSNCSTMS
jgi:hypothetical protein